MRVLHQALEYGFLFQLRVFETFKHNIHQIFMKGSQMSSVTPSNTIVV